MFPPVSHQSQFLVISRLLPGELLVSQGLLVGGAVVDLVGLLLLQLGCGSNNAIEFLHSTGLPTLYFIR